MLYLNKRLHNELEQLSFLQICDEINPNRLPLKEMRDRFRAEYPKLEEKIRNLPVPDLTIEEMSQTLSRWEGIEKEKESLAKEIQDTDNLIDAKVFRLYGLEREEIFTVLDSLGTDEEIKADILEKWKQE